MVNFDFVKETFVTLPQLREGRDMRNKVVFIKGIIYSIGGNNYSAEKFKLETN
jgi:hypothetical protein